MAYPTELSTHLSQLELTYLFETSNTIKGKIEPRTAVTVIGKIHAASGVSCARQGKPVNLNSVTIRKTSIGIL